MTDVFISYKREDEVRAGRLVRALEGAGLSVWWDRGLPGGEDWRANIEAALDAAKVVVVCWTHASAGPEGGFVRDEAARAGGRLVPVFLERGVRLPLGFGKLHALELWHWRGDPNDPYFQDLLATVLAKRDGAPAPKPKGPAARAMRKFLYGGGVAAVASALAGFAWSMPVVRAWVCTLPVAQPALSGSCCRAGFTETPLVRDAGFTPAPLRKIGYLRQSARAFATEAEARGDAGSRLAADAALLCAVVDAEFERLSGIEAAATRYACSETPAGWTCAADYRATCAIERRELVQRCPG